VAKGFAGGMDAFLRHAQKEAVHMQKRLADLQRDLKERVYDGNAGGGMVTAHVNGQRELLAIKISPEVVDPGDVEMLEDLVTAAVSQAIKKASDAYTEEMGKLTGGIALPGLM
jgi:hypothetical protein